MSLAAYATTHGVPAEFLAEHHAVITVEDGADLTAVVPAWVAEVKDHRAYLREKLRLNRLLVH